MGACNADDDRTPGERRVGPRIKLYPANYRWHVPENPPEWDAMGPNEQAEWEKARELVLRLNVLVDELRWRELLGQFREGS